MYTIEAIIGEKDAIEQIPVEFSNTTKIIELTKTIYMLPLGGKSKEYFKTKNTNGLIVVGFEYLFMYLYDLIKKYSKNIQTTSGSQSY